MKRKHERSDSIMEWLATITFDQIGMSFLAVFITREAMIYALPDDIAGPGGWLIDTGFFDFEQ